MNRVLGFVAAVLLFAGGTTVVGTHPASFAGPGDGTLTVRVVRDVNGNGTYEAAVELGVAGALVTVVDAAGGTATGVTGADGSVVVDLATVTGGKYRVQVTPPTGSVLVPAPAGAGLVSNTEFVDVSSGRDATVTTGLWNPSDYCQANPRLAVACQRPSVRRNGTSNVDPTARALVTFSADQRGTSPSTQIANQGDLGTTYGIAYRRQDRRLFAGAFAKRVTNYGPGGPGAVYVVPAAGGPATVFATVPNAGTATHTGVGDPTFDGTFYGVPGTQSLGDIDISEDGTELYVVNMNDKRLYVYNATLPAAAAPKASYPIPPGACGNPVDWRPGALGVHDGILYVGGVCSGQSTGLQSDVKAVVYTFQGGAFVGPVLTKTLDFPRGMATDKIPASNRWYAWSDTWADTLQSTTGGRAYPMPLLTDIEVENNGDLVLGFRDRFGDMTGSSTPPPDGGGGTWATSSGGDLNRACLTASGGYDWEGSGTCPNNHVVPNGGNQPAQVEEYYPGDYLGGAHMELAMGATALLRGEQRIPSTVVDPIVFDSGGVGWFDRTTGGMRDAGSTNAYQVMPADSASGFAKTNSLGDLEVLCDLAPVQIGNRVWFDADRDGVQDPDEVPIAGVRVIATPVGGGPPLPTMTTNARGEYYFGTADGLLPNTGYVLTFDYSGIDPAQLPGAPPVDNLTWTQQAAGADRTVDSNVDSVGAASVTTGSPGSVDHTIDAGIVPILHPAVTIAKTADPPVVREGDTVTFTLTVTNTGDTPLLGVVVTDAVAPGCARTFATLAVAEVQTYTCTMVAPAADFTNSATVIGADADGQSVTATATAPVDVIHPAVTIAKTADPSVVREGGTVTFTLTVRNTGDVTLTGVTIADPAAPGCDRTFATLAAAEVQTYTCTMTAPAADLTNTATVTGNDPSGQAVTATGSAPVDVIHPALTVAKTANPAVVREGDTITFTLTVTNTGDVALTSVAVTDPVTPGCTRTFTTLAVAEVQTHTCTTVAPAADFTNTATATGNDTTGQPVTASGAAAVEVITPSVAVEKAADGMVFREGDTVTFTLVVTNTGDTPLTGVTVADPSTPGCDRTFATLAPADVQTYTCTMVAPAADFTNAATVTGDDPLGRSVTATDDVSLDVVHPSLAMTKTADSAVAAEGDVVTFTVTVTNTGDTALTDVTVVDALAPPCGRTFATLAVGEVRTYTCTMTATAADFTNTATVTGDDPSGLPPNAVTEATQAIDVVSPGMEVAKSPPATPVWPGRPAAFTVVVRNTGDVTLTDITVDDPLAPGCSSVIASLEPGQSSAPVACELVMGDGDLVNGVQVEGHYGRIRTFGETDEATAEVAEPSFDLVKTAGQGSVTAGGTVTFTLTVRNTGNVALTDVHVVDPTVPACDRHLDVLAAGMDESWTCTTQAPPGGSLVNNATATATAQGDPLNTARTDDGSVTVTVTPADQPADPPADQPADPPADRSSSGIPVTGSSLRPLMIGGALVVLVGGIFLLTGKRRRG